MARIEWAQLCELAFLDSCDRLCLIGITTRLPVPALPLTVHQLMVAARIVDVRQWDELEVEVSMLTPRGLSSSPDRTSLSMTVAGEFLLITLRDIPLIEEGVHRLLVSVRAGEPISLDIAVQCVSTPAPLEVH